MFRKLHYTTSVRNIAQCQLNGKRSSVTNFFINTKRKIRNNYLAAAFQQCAFSTEQSHDPYYFKTLMEVKIRRESDGKFSEHATIKCKCIGMQNPNVLALEGATEMIDSSKGTLSAQNGEQQPALDNMSVTVANQQQSLKEVPKENIIEQSLHANQAGQQNPQRNMHEAGDNQQQSPKETPKENIFDQILNTKEALNNSSSQQSLKEAPNENISDQTPSVKEAHQQPAVNNLQSLKEATYENISDQTLSVKEAHQQPEVDNIIDETLSTKEAEQQPAVHNLQSLKEAPNENVSDQTQSVKEAQQQSAVHNLHDIVAGPQQSLKEAPNDNIIDETLSTKEAEQQAAVDNLQSLKEASNENISDQTLSVKETQQQPEVDNIIDETLSTKEAEQQPAVHNLQSLKEAPNENVSDQTQSVKEAQQQSAVHNLHDIVAGPQQSLKEAPNDNIIDETLSTKEAEQQAAVHNLQSLNEAPNENISDQTQSVKEAQQQPSVDNVSNIVESQQLSVKNIIEKTLRPKESEQEPAVHNMRDTVANQHESLKKPPKENNMHYTWNILERKVDRELEHTYADYRDCQLRGVIKPFVKESTLDKIRSKINAKSVTCADCITIVGWGELARAISILLLQKGLTKELIIMDKQPTEVTNELLEVENIIHNEAGTKIHTCTTVFGTTKSDFVILASEAKPQPTLDTMEMAQLNMELLKNFIPRMVNVNPRANYIVLSQPMELMTWATQKMGNLEPSQCFTTGCHLDTTRFLYYLSRRLDVASSAVNGYIIGCSGKGSVPAWSSVVVGGMPLRLLKPYMGTELDNENWADIHKQVVKGISPKKGYCNSALALATIDIIEALHSNSKRILTVATNVRGFNNIEEDVVLSLPCVLTRDGISQILELPLSNWERRKLDLIVKEQVAAQSQLKL